MKKIALLSLCILLALSAACPALPAAYAEEEIPVDVTIGEKMFIAQTDDIYFNANDFLGKTIKLEGMFFNLSYGPDEPPFYTVTRYGPGCCGNDGTIGFIVWLDEDADLSVPENDDWVEAIGVLEIFEMYDQEFLRLNLKSLKVLDVRGLETVVQ